jgi:hypothetical protein
MPSPKKRHVRAESRRHAGKERHCGKHGLHHVSVQVLGELVLYFGLLDLSVKVIPLLLCHIRESGGVFTYIIKIL